MTNKLRVLCTLLLCMIASVGWSDEVTFVPGDFGQNQTVTFNKTKEGITIEVTKSTTTLDEIRIYKGQTITISSSSATITKIVFNCTAKGTAQYGPGCFASQTGYTYSEKVGTWEGSAKSVSFTASSNQVRATSIVITYTNDDTPPDTREKATLSFPEASYNATLGESFSTPELTVDPAAATSEVEYSSRNTAVASVNATTGAITLNGSGTTLITAAISDSENYMDASASYELTVIDNSPHETITFSEEELENGTEVTNVAGDNYTVTFDKGTGSNAPKYYDSGTAIRAYGGNTFTVSSISKTITRIVLTFGDGEGSNEITTDVGSYTSGTWTGEASSVKFTIEGTSGHRRISAITVYYKDVAIAVPVFTLAEGTYTGAQTVEITCATADATIMYRTDNENWTEYTEAISVASSTTIYAKAVNGTVESNVVSATYTIIDPNAPGQANNPYTVAQAISAIDDGNGTTDVFVKGIVSQVDQFNSNYSSITYWISDDGTTTNQFEVYSGKGINGANFESINDIQIGDVVVVKGNIKKFNSTYEFDYNNELVSLKRKEAPTLTFEEEAYSVVKNGELKIIATSSNSTGAITYQSSDTDVAEIEAATGVVTAKAAGTTTITATIAATEEYNTTTATVELTVTAPKHKVTFYQDGTKLSEEEFTEDTPITFPDAEPIINGKTFVGWIAEPINGTIENAPTTLVTSATMGESDAEYYAVYAKAEGEGGQATVSDVLTLTTTGVSGTSYTDWSGKTVTSSAVYAGQSAGGNDAIQLRSDKSSAGVVTTTSGGKATKVVVTWNSNTAAGRTLNIYGSNTAYTAATDLYGENAGSLLGTIVNGTSTELTINENYEYVGLRSASGAMYLDNITITWQNGTSATYTDYCTTVKTYVAQVGDVKYETFADAVEAANGNDITLLADIEEAYTLAEGQTLTVNHNGHSLTVNPPAGYILDMTELGETTIAYTYTQAVAKIGDKLYASLQDAIEDAEAGATIDVQQDVDATDYYSSNTARMPISKSMTINGNGRTVTVAGRGFGVGMNASDKIDVTFKDITIQNSGAGARCIDTRGNLNSLTLENATLKTDGAQSGYTQPLTIGGNQSDVAKVNIINSNIQTNDEGTAYYAIITFNPVEMNITNSTIKGWANIYAKGKDGSAGSAGSVFTLDGCTLVSSNAYSGVSNSFAAFMTEDNNVTYNIKNSKITINNSGDQIQAIASYQLNNTLTRNSVTLGEGNEVTFVEPGTFAYVNNQNEGNTFVITGGTYNVDPTPYLAEGLAAPLIGGVYTVMPASAIPAAPIIFHDSGEYESELQIAMAGEGTIMYTLNDGEAQTYSAPFTIREDATIKAWAVKDGVASDVTEPKTFTIKEKAKSAKVDDGYYTIQNNEGKYVNVAGRKTVTLVSDTKSAGTVIRVKAEEDGVKVLRSQAVDLPRYAERAMSYVPEIVKEVVKKLAANVDDPIIGEQGAELILDKFNQEFDYHLYLEGENNTYRIYGRTPSMKPVVDFYAENKELVDSRLPRVEDFVKEVLQKVVDKVGHGQSVVDMFKVKTVWTNMGGTLTDPDVDQAKFFEEVLSSEKNTWEFAYQTGMLYWDKVKSYLEDNTSELGDYGKYIEKIPQIRPNFKYYIVPSTSGVDIISEGNSEIADASTTWTLTKRDGFDVTFDASLSKNNGKEMYKTLYVDFAYELPENVKALKVTGVTEAGVAETEEITGVVPAQTPVLLMSTDTENLTKALTLSTEDGTTITDNLLKGNDYLINEYEINSSTVEGVFTILAELSQSLADKYEYLKRKNAGTVNNKYFFGLDEADIELCIFKNENNEEDCVIRNLSVDDNGLLGFYNNWTANANEAFLVSETFNPILLTKKGDVDRDGDVDEDDLKALVEIVLGKVTVENNPDDYDFDAAHVNDDEDINIADVTALVNILKPQPQD